MICGCFYLFFLNPRIFSSFSEKNQLDVDKVDHHFVLVLLSLLLQGKISLHSSVLECTKTTNGCKTFFFSKLKRWFFRTLGDLDEIRNAFSQWTEVIDRVEDFDAVQLTKLV